MFSTKFTLPRLPANRRKLLWAGVIFLIATLIFWLDAIRYPPIRINVAKIEKVVQAGAGELKSGFCASFNMTPQEFSAYFGQIRHIDPIEANDYGTGGCYYKATIGTKEYIIWEGGLAQVVEGSDVDYYADSTKKMPANP